MGRLRLVQCATLGVDLVLLPGRISADVGDPPGFYPEADSKGVQLAQAALPAAPDQPVKPASAKVAKAGEPVASENALAQLCEQQRIKIRLLEENRE